MQLNCNKIFALPFITAVTSMALETGSPTVGTDGVLLAQGRSMLIWQSLSAVVGGACTK